MQTYSIFRCAFFKPSSSARLVYELSSAPSSTPAPAETTEARKVTDIDNQKRFSPTEAANAARNSSDAASREFQAACAGALCGFDSLPSSLNEDPKPQQEFRINEFRALGERVKDIAGSAEANNALIATMGISWDSLTPQVGHDKFATRTGYENFMSALGTTIDATLVDSGESWQDVLKDANPDMQQRFNVYVTKENLRKIEGVSALLKEDDVPGNVKANIEMALLFAASLAQTDGLTTDQVSRINTALNAFGNEGARTKAENFTDGAFKNTISQLVTLATSGMSRNIDFNDATDADADLARAAMAKVPGLTQKLGVSIDGIASR